MKKLLLALLGTASISANAALVDLEICRQFESDISTIFDAHFSGDTEKAAQLANTNRLKKNYITLAKLPVDNGVFTLEDAKYSFVVTVTAKCVQDELVSMLR